MVTQNSGFGARSTFVWAGVVAAMAVPVAATATSPLLQWRDPIYIAAGFAGIIGFALLLVQPMLATGLLPGISDWRARRLHRWVGGGLTTAVIVHVAALWITSPPDVVDALLLVSPTPFSVWGVVAMWAVFGSGLIAVFRRRFSLRVWRLVHTVLVVVIVAGSVVHVVLIDGTMETVSKTILSVLVVAVTVKAIVDRKPWTTAKR